MSHSADVSVCSITAKKPFRACFILKVPFSENIKGPLNGRDKYCLVLEIGGSGLICVEIRKKHLCLEGGGVV